MHAYIHTYIQCIHAYTYTHTHIHAYIHTSIHPYILTNLYTLPRLWSNEPSCLASCRVTGSCRCRWRHACNSSSPPYVNIECCCHPCSTALEMFFRAHALAWMWTITTARAPGGTAEAKWTRCPAKGKQITIIVLLLLVLSITLLLFMSCKWFLRLFVYSPRFLLKFVHPRYEH